MADGRCAKLEPFIVFDDPTTLPGIDLDSLSTWNRTDELFGHDDETIAHVS